MSKCEKQVVTKLNKKLEKYGLSREELELKLHSASLYGSTVMKMSELDYVRENYCSNRDVFTSNYDCPYATVVNNSVVCTSKECNNSSDYYKRYYLLGDIPKPTIPVDWNPNLADEDYPF